jgi:hypothetical protein
MGGGVGDPGGDRADRLAIDPACFVVFERCGWAGAVEEEVVVLGELDDGDAFAPFQAFEPDVEVVRDGDLVVALAL